MSPALILRPTRNPHWRVWPLWDLPTSLPVLISLLGLRCVPCSGDPGPPSLAPQPPLLSPPLPAPQSARVSLVTQKEGRVTAPRNPSVSLTLAAPQTEATPRPTSGPPLPPAPHRAFPARSGHPATRVRPQLLGHSEQCLPTPGRCTCSALHLEGSGPALHLGRQRQCHPFREATVSAAGCNAGPRLCCLPSRPCHDLQTLYLWAHLQASFGDGGRGGRRLVPSPECKFHRHRDRV